MPFTAEEAFDLLSDSRKRGRFGQGYLISGAKGSGKRKLVERLAALLLGETRDPMKNADVHIVEPQMKTRIIGVDAIRDLLGELQLSSLLGGVKIAIIQDADRMNTEAANALLRTLEEPPRKTHFFLLTEQPEQLLETILSRCIEVPLRTTERISLTPRQKALLETLQKLPGSGSADLSAVFNVVRQFTALLAETKAEIQEATEEAFKKEEAVFKQVGSTKSVIDERETFFKALTESRYRSERDGLLAIIEQWFADALRQQHGAPELDHPEMQEATAALAKRFTTGELLRRAAALTELRDHFGRTIQEQLAIECAFLKAFGS
jgi:DNA polymerase III subunit delta'